MLPVFIGSFVLLLSCKSFLFWMQARFVFCKYFLPNVAYFLVNLNMSFKECELILCVTLARLRYPVIWSKIIMDISVKVFYFWGGVRLTFKLVDQNLNCKSSLGLQFAGLYCRFWACQASTSHELIP